MSAPTLELPPMPNYVARRNYDQVSKVCLSHLKTYEFIDKVKGSGGVNLDELKENLDTVAEALVDWKRQFENLSWQLPATLETYKTESVLDGAAFIRNTLKGIVTAEEYKPGIHPPIIIAGARQHGKTVEAERKVAEHEASKSTPLESKGFGTGATSSEAGAAVNKLANSHEEYQAMANKTFEDAAKKLYANVSANIMGLMVGRYAKTICTVREGSVEVRGTKYAAPCKVFDNGSVLCFPDVETMDAMNPKEKK